MNTKNSVVYIVLLALMLYAMLSLTAVGRELSHAEAVEAELLERLERQEEANAALRLKLEQGRSREEIEQQARERLKLVYPGDKIFYFTDREG